MTLKKSWVLGVISLTVLTGIGTACGAKKDAALDTSSNTITTVSQTGGSSALQMGSKPSLDAQYVLAGNSVTITYKVSNFQLSADHMGGAKVPGEGHVHLTVDGKDKAMLKTEAPVKLENLTVGKHTIKLDLKQNDHTALNIEKIINIEVK
jgi:hypothetical protein